MRSRHDLAPAALCACFIESAERFLDVVRGGTRMRGFFPMLMPIFSAHAFDGAYPGHARFSQYLSQQVPPSTAISFGTWWHSMQQEVRGRGVAGPLDATIGAAGDGRATSAGLQRLITAQREQVARDRLHAAIMQLPHGDTRGGRRGCRVMPSRRRGLGRGPPSVTPSRRWSSQRCCPPTSVARALLCVAWLGA